MRRLRSVSILLFLLHFLPSVADAQAISFEIVGRAGGTKLWDDEGNIGFGPSAGAGIAVRLPSGFAVEGLLERLDNHREFSAIHRIDSKGMAVTGRFLKYLGSSSVQPYFGGGGGFGRITTTIEFPGFPTTERTTTSSNFSGFSGLRIATGAHTFIRPEFQMTVQGEHLRIAGTIGAVVAW